MSIDMNIVGIVYKSLEGAVALLARDIEKASNQVVKINSKVSEASFKLNERIDYYNELIREAQDQHAAFLADNTKSVQSLIIRRNTASRLKSAITNLTTGEIV